MTIDLEQDEMAKKPGRPKSDRDEGTCKVDRALLAKARLIASDRKISIGEVMSMASQVWIEREWAKIVRRLDKVKDKKPKGDT